MPKTKSLSPPYMAANLFRSTVEVFAESTTPNALDRHILSHLSGADYGSLLSGLRFFGLVSGRENVVQDRYRALVEARKKGESQYKGVLLSIAEPAYEGIVQGVDIERGSLPQIEKAFKDAGVPPGQMLIKTVRFYIKIMLDGGKSVSPHITKPRRPTQHKANGRGPKTTVSPTITKETPPKDSDEQEVPTGYQRLEVPMVPGAYIQYPTSLTEAQCTIFESVVELLRTAAKVNQEEGVE